MASYDNLKVYKTAFDLMKSIYLLTHVPRDVKFTILQDVKKEIVTLMVYISKAHESIDKIGFIKEARASLVAVTMYLRLMCELKYISVKTFASLTVMTDSLSKQLKCWQKYHEEKGKE